MPVNRVDKDSLDRTLGSIIRIFDRKDTDIYTTAFLDFLVMGKNPSRYFLYCFGIAYDTTHVIVRSHVLGSQYIIGSTDSCSILVLEDIP